MVDELKRRLKLRYGSIAKYGGSCCPSSAPSCGCGASCSTESGLPASTAGYSEKELSGAPPESKMGLGCGNPVQSAALREGEVVLDLGSGGGMDAFLAAKRVGKRGKVIGVDMTEEMVERARATAVKYGYDNVEFRLGDIESLPVEDVSVDVVISNCVINLALDKRRVFGEVYRVLKPGGRMVVSDIVSEGRIPDEVKSDPEAWSSCIAGAVEESEYLDLMKGAGFAEVRVLSESKYAGALPSRPAAKLKSMLVAATKPAVPRT